MQRYFAEEPFNEQNQVRLFGENRKHLATVMRMHVGERIIVVSEQQAYEAIIQNISETEVLVQRQGNALPSNELPVQVTIACGLAKGDKHDWVAQKATELGMYEMLLFSASRSIVKWDEKKGGKKLERYEKISESAAKQCHRTIRPTVRGAYNLSELLALGASYDWCLIADEENAKGELSNRLAEVSKEIQKGQSVLVVFGPEGGLTREEAAACRTAGFHPVALGPRILRTETAPLYVLAAFSYLFE